LRGSIATSSTVVVKVPKIAVVNHTARAGPDHAEYPSSRSPWTMA